MLANNNIAHALPEAWQSEAVPITNDELRVFPGLRLIEADVVAEENRYRHDPVKLAGTLMRMYDDRDTLTLEPAARSVEEPLLATR